MAFLSAIHPSRDIHNYHNSMMRLTAAALAADFRRMIMLKVEETFGRTGMRVEANHG